MNSSDDHIITVMRIGLIGLVLALFAGCSAAPSKETVEAVIVHHFEKRHYKVTDLMIGNISPLPMGEKEYMGTEGYIVNVVSITLQFTRDTGEPRNYKKGNYLTFTNGRIHIKKSRDNKSEWIVTNIEGIPLL